VVGFWLPIPNKLSNNFEAIGGTVIGTGAMKLASFSWTLYLEGNNVIKVKTKCRDETSTTPKVTSLPYLSAL
jgi:hypothetical protein